MLPVVVAPLPWGVGTSLHEGLADALPPGTAVALPAPGADYEATVAAVEAARRARGWPRCVVVGHSMASLVATDHALRHPGGLGGLVLVGGVPGRSAFREGLWRPGHPRHAPWLAAMQALRADGDMRAYVRRLVELSLARPEAMAPLDRDLAGAGVDPARMDVFFRHELPRIDLGPRLAAVRAPALVVAGRDDPLCTAAQSEALAGALPGAQLVVLDDCGHFPWYEQPAAFRDALARFLGAL